MGDANWVKYFPAAIIVADENGTIIEMNIVSIIGAQKEGGANLIGSNVVECHKEPSLSKIKKLYETQSQNIYFTTKNGQKMLIYQTPYFVDGKFSGIVEMSLPLPDKLEIGKNSALY